MPDFKITLPDGASYKVTAPDEGTAYSALQTSLAGQPKAETGRGGVLPSFAEGLATGFTDIPLGIAGLFTARPEETTAGKFSLGARDVIQDILGIDPTKEATTAETGASALGSLGSFLVPGLGAVKVAKGVGMGLRGAGAAGSIASGLQGAALGSGEQAQRAMAQEQETGKQVSDEARRSAQLLGGAIGLSEILPLQRFLGPLEAILAKVPLSKASVVADIMQTGITRAAKSATAEGAQEAISQLAQNLVESGLYNPELDVTEGLLGNAAAGGFAGGTVDAILQLMAGRKVRKATATRGQLEKQISAEASEAAPEIIRAQAIEGVNTLRAAAPAGSISVIESQMPGDRNASYYIVGADKKPIVKFDSIDAAIAAGKQYEADSNGVAKFEPPTITELVKMKKAKEPKLTKAQKNQARQEAKRLKAAGQLQPAPIAGPATTPEGQATTEASIEKVVAEEPIIAPKKGRKKLAPIEAPVPGAALPPIDTAAEITLPEQPEAAPELTADQRVALWKSIAPQAETFRDLNPEQQAVYFEELKKAQPTAAQASKLSTAPAQPTAPEAVTQPAVEVPEGFRQVVKEVQPTVRVALRPLESTPEGAAKAAEMDAKKGRVADTLNKILAPIVAKNVRLNLVSHLKEGETYARGAVNPEGTVIDLALDIYDPALTEDQLIDKLMGVMNHEVIHTLRNANLLTPAEITTLFNATDKIKYQGKAFTYFDRAYRTYATIESYTTVNESGDRIPNMNMINEEAVAEMFRDYRSGKLKIGEKPKGIFNKIIQFFKRMFRSFRDAEVGKVFTRIESGEVGARERVEAPAAAETKFSVSPSAYEAVPFVERPAAVQNQILGDVERMRRKANDIAKDVVRKGDTNFDNAANAANIEVRNAVRKLSAIPQPQPQSAFFQAANATLFASTPTPTSTGERLMDLLGGLGTSAGRTKILDAFRVNYVQKQGQIAKYQRVAELAGKLESGMAQYSAVASSEMADRSSHQIPLIIEFGAGEVMMVNNDPNSKYFIVNQNEMENAPKEFFKLVYTGGPNGTSLMDQFKTILVARAVVKRQSEGKQTPIEVTPEYIKRAEDLALQYPVLEDAYGRYQKFNKKMIKAAMDAGVISQDTFENFTDDMNYYSLYREVGDEILSPEPYGATGRATKIKAYKGSDQGKLIADPMEAMIRNISFWTAATMRNIAAQKAYRVAKEVGISRKLNWQGSKLGWEDPDPKRGEDARYLSYNIDGKEFRYAVTDPLFATGLLNTEGHNMGLALELLGMPTTALRELVTRDPGFMIANLLRDSMSTWILAGSGASPLGTFIGMKKALMNDVSYQSLKRMAVVGSYDEAQKSPRQMVAGLKAGIVNAQGLNGTVDVLKYGWDRLGKLSDASDAATRIAVYEAAIKDGVDEYTAAYRALSVMNFSRRGASMGISVATKLIPFLNARIQGFDVLYTGIKAGVQLAQGAEQTAFEKQRGAAVWYRGAGLMAGALALAMLNEDDEDYKQIPQYIKDANFLVPIGGSKFISIPKPFEAGLIFGTVPTTLYDIMRGNRSTRSGIKLFTSQLGSTFGFNPMPQVALPLFENLTNSDFYTGMPLISPGMQKLDPSLQYNSSTSYVARSLGKLLAYTPFGYDFESGKFEGVSPIMIDNLITGYGGPIGGYVSMGIGGLIGAFGQDNQGIPIAGSNLPVIKRFFIDAQDKQPQAAAEAYEVYQLVDKATRTASRLKKMGDMEALKEFREENIDLLRVGKQVRKMAENLNNIRAQVRRLEVNTTMSGSEKKERMRELRAREIQLTRKIDDINAKLGR